MKVSNFADGVVIQIGSFTFTPGWCGRDCVQSVGPVVITTKRSLCHEHLIPGCLDWVFFSVDAGHFTVLIKSHIFFFKFLDIPHQNEIKKSEEIDKYCILMNLNAKINTHQTKRTPSAALLWRQLSWFPIQETTFFRLFYLFFLRHLLLILLLLFTKPSGQKSAAKKCKRLCF